MNHPTRAFVAAVLAAGLAGAAPAAASVPSASTVLVSGPSAGLPYPFDGDGEAQADAQATSDDGRYVLFLSYADGLVPAGAGQDRQAYVKDRTTGTVTLVSRATGADGAAPPQGVADATLSGNGQVVAFTTFSPLVPGDTNSTLDVYVRDLVSGVTERVSVADNEAQGTGFSNDPAIDADGSRVSFTTYSRFDAVNDTTVNGPDVYVRDRSAGTTTLASRAPGGTNAGSTGSSQSALDATGNRVAFETDGTWNAGDTGTDTDVYVRDLGANQTLYASRATGGAGTQGNGSSTGPSLTSAGTVVAFSSAATNLSGSDGNTSTDVYIRNLATDTTTLVSRKDGFGAAGDQGSERGEITADGSRVVFDSGATDLDAADPTDDRDVYVHHLGSGETTLVSRATGLAGAAPRGFDWHGSPDADGSVIAFESETRGLTGSDFDVVFAREPGAGTTERVSTLPGGQPGQVNDAAIDSAGCAMSADGRYVVFTSESDALSALDDDTRENAYLRDMRTGTVTLLARATDGSPANGDVQSVCISPDGSTVGYDTDATNLVAGHPNDGQNHLVVHRLATDERVIADRVPGGAYANSGPGAFAFSADGRVVAFGSYADNLSPDDPSSSVSTYVADLAAGTLELASRAPGAGGANANDSTLGPAISADGRYVAFSTEATNLPDDGGGNVGSIYVRDRVTHATVLASRGDGATGPDANQFTAYPSISADGRYVAFISRATNFGDGGDNGSNQARVRDLVAGRTYVASRRDGPDGQVATASAFRAELSADGTKVAFVAGTGALGFPGTGQQVFLRDLAAGTTQVVSAASGSTAPASTKDVFELALSADGGCAAFSTRSLGMADGPTSGDFTLVYYRAISRECAPTPPPPPVTPPTTTPPAPGKDTTRPVVSRVRVSPSTVRRGRKATISFRVSEPGRVVATVYRNVPGRLKGRTCVRPSKAPKNARRCTLGLTVRTLRVTLRAAGTGRVTLPATIRRKRLVRGSYVVRVVATDTAGNRSRAAAKAFRVR